MKKIDLNVDIGEGFSFDSELLDFASSANVCCGEHAGNWDLTCATVEMCLARGVRVGIHPGYPDRATMGRKSISAEDVDEYQASILRQVRRFYDAFLPSYIKPHGAFYNDAIFIPEALEMLSEVMQIVKLPVMGLARTPVEALAVLTHCGFMREGFADRAYKPDGTLVPRGTPGAVFDDPNKVREQVIRIAPLVDTICLHGDNPDCIEFAEMVTATLIDSGYLIGS